jgi:hypothetical protein
MFINENLVAVKTILDALAAINKARIQQEKEIEQFKTDLDLLINLKSSLPNFGSKN